MNIRKYDISQPGTRVVLMLSLLLAVQACFKDPPEFPDTLEWNPGIAFPLGEKSYGLNAESGFDTTLLELDTITEVPRWVGEAEVVMEGILDFSLASIQENLDKVNGIMFRVNLYNGFPNPLLAQAYFLDNAANTLDSMFKDGPVRVPPGNVTGEGESVTPAHEWEDALFDGTRIQNLRDATEILFRATLVVETPDTAWIPYYPSYQLNVRIGAMLDFEMEL